MSPPHNLDGKRSNLFSKVKDIQPASGPPINDSMLGYVKFYRYRFFIDKAILFFIPVAMKILVIFESFKK